MWSVRQTVEKSEVQKMWLEDMLEMHKRQSHRYVRFNWGKRQGKKDQADLRQEFEKLITKIEVRGNETIRDLKVKIQKKEGTSQNKQRLIFAGKQLEDSYTLDEYNIEKESTIKMLSRLKGGTGEEETKESSGEEKTHESPDN